jgi:hypothetical protein
MILHLIWPYHPVYIANDNDVHFVLDQHAELDIYSVSSLKQQSAGRHITPLHAVSLCDASMICIYM